ncbi:MAG: VOC family protein [Pseudonocardiaceae bacterium]|nr:VOC family protein [Pseudonocardiaceae bacterium]
MTTAHAFTPGTPCWVDASSSDPAGSRDFYAGLLGWTYRMEADPQTGHYTYAVLDDLPVAGLSGIAAEPGQPVEWTVYLASANISYTASVVEQHGGQLLYGPVDIPEQGSMLIGGDPTGASIGFWQPVTSWVFHNQGPGTFSWAELNTWDGTVADEFFARIFGYRQRQIGDDTVDYTTWGLGDQTYIGRLQMGAGFPAETRPHWLAHFAIDPDIGIDAAAFRAVQLGGRIRVDPFDSGLGRISVIDDPLGATFALIDATRTVEPAGGPAAVDDPYDD